jgi:glycosyltransferase involved in cell wall biosynthesis
MSKIENMKIVIGIPAYNEEKNIASLLIKLKKISQTIIVCNDGSTDLTGKIAKELGATVIEHEKNSGYGSAIKSIFLKAHEIDADVLVTFDADGQHRIEDINVILEPIKNNIADIVIGSRFLNNNQEIPKYREIGIKAITKLTNVTGGTKITDSQSGFRAYNKKILDKIKPQESGMGISTEILIKSQKADFKITEVPITVLYDGDTSTHNPISHGSSVILSTLKYVAIERPLVFYGIPGIIFLLIGLAFGIWTIQIYSEEGMVITNIALVGVSGVIMGTILILTSTILYSIVSVVRR